MYNDIDGRSRVGNRGSGIRNRDGESGVESRGSGKEEKSLPASLKAASMAGGAGMKIWVQPRALAA